MNENKENQNELTESKNIGEQMDQTVSQEPSVDRDELGRVKKGSVLNPKGRPKLGTSLTEIMREYLDKSAKGHDLTRKEEFVRKVVKMAYDGDSTMIKLVWNYIDGMPKQTIDMTTSTKTTPEELNEIDEQLKKQTMVGDTEPDSNTDQ